MARIFLFPTRSRRPFLSDDVPAPRRIFGRRRNRDRYADEPAQRPRRGSGPLARLRQRLRWFEFRHPVQSVLAALLLPVLVVGGYAAWRADAAAHPRVREVLDVTLHPLGAIPDSLVALVIPGRFGDCALMPWGDCVLDGDTIRMNGASVRLMTIDTPEIFSPKCSAELALGRRAAARLRQLLNEGEVALQRSGPRDRDQYDRLLRIVSVDGASPGYTLVREGLARRWDGARRGWC